MENYISTLETEFEKNANTIIALEQKAYMRNRFEFFGIKTPVRRSIQKPFLQKDMLPQRKELYPVIKYLWQKNEREYQYFTQELAQKYFERLDWVDIELYEYMITRKSWWDTVDIIATKLVGKYFNKFPEQIMLYTNKWMNSGNIWLQRTAILFQLKYKDQTDTELLSSIINRLNQTDEFFINKAIGWILRQYNRINPKWVRAFVNKTELDKLSRREAIRLISKDPD